MRSPRATGSPSSPRSRIPNPPEPPRSSARRLSSFEELEQALDRVDPEIFLLSPAEADDDESPLEAVLDLLAAVPAGKLAIADLPLTTPDDVLELERAGCDAVIVHGPEIAPLAGGPPPEV